MANITPTASFVVAYDRDAYGLMTYCGDDLSWHLADLTGRDDTEFTGLTKDPTEDYLIQQPVLIPVSADPTQWTLLTSGATPAAWSAGLDGTSQKSFISQNNGAVATPFSATFKTLRVDDEGVSLNIFRGAAMTAVGGSQPIGANYAMYVEFSSGRQAQDYGLRLAIEAGNPIRLEGSFDGIAWTTLDIASDQGDSEDYLNAWGRYLQIDVVPLTSRAWYDALPQSTQWSDPPQDIICVSLNNGDVILKFQTDQAYLAAGAVAITGTGGQWSCRYSKRRYVVSANFITNEIVRYRAFQTDPRCFFRGFSPFNDLGVIIPTLTDINKCYVSVAISAIPSDVDATGYAIHTVILSSVDVDFPRSFIGAATVPTTVTNQPIAYTEQSFFDQSTFCTRSSALITLEDNGGALAPGGIIPAVRAAYLSRGWIYDDGSTDAQIGITGLTALDSVQGIRWFYEGKQKFVQISISDKFRRGDSDLATIGYLLPFDNQCHFYALRQIFYRMGIGDDFLNFPFCQRDSQCAHYHLPQGTNAAPLLRFQPQTSPMSAALQIRGMSGEYAPDGKTILPMYLYMDSAGIVQYFPAPVGLIKTWLDPSLSIQSQSIPLFQTYSMVPGFTAGFPNLNEMVGSSMGSTASLANIRTPIVFEGLSPKSGDVILGTSYNPGLGGSLLANPNQFGYIGVDSPIFNISRLFSSQEAVNVALQVATIQTSFPAIRTNFTAHLQSGLRPLMAIGVQDFGTQGTTGTVPYYVTSVTNRADLGIKPWAISEVGARLLGQAN